MSAKRILSLVMGLISMSAGGCQDGRFGVVGVNQPPVIDGEIQHTFDGLFVVTVSVSARDPEGGAVGYLWNFGDGTGDQKLPSPTQYTYQKRGNFLVRVTVSDSDGGVNSTTARIQVKGDNQRPVARVVVIPQTRNPCVGDTVILDGSTSSDPDNDDFVKEYSWTYETGTSAQKAVQVAFDNPRDYRVTLRVRDTFGDESFLATTLVCVRERPLCAESVACPEQ